MVLKDLDRELVAKVLKCTEVKVLGVKLGLEVEEQVVQYKYF